MKGLTLFRRTTKSEGNIKLRFRLRDGRGVDLYHKSEIKADLKDLSKFEDDGTLRPRSLSTTMNSKRKYIKK